MSDARPSSQELGEQFLKSLDKSHVGAAASKLFAASVGDVVVVFSRSPAHKHFSLADIEWMVLPPVQAGQVYVVQAVHKECGFCVPIAVATWAFVSEEVDRRLGEQAGRHMRLRPDEWTSGEIGWLIDVVGRPADIRSAFEWLAIGPFKDRPLKVVVRDDLGAASVTTLDQLLTARVHEWGNLA